MMFGIRPPARIVCVCALVVAISGAGVFLLTGFDDGIPTSPVAARFGRHNGQLTASFKDRFQEAAAFAIRPSASDAEVERAKVALTDGLIAQLNSAPAVPIANPEAITVPVPRARPPEAQLAQIGSSMPVRDQLPSVTGDPITEALRKVLAFLQPAPTRLASAAPDGGVSSNGNDLQPGTTEEMHTAIYDISAKTVYMPDGTQLEAHSGLGEWMDDPLQVAVRDKGPTPPNVYALTLREKPFHGVQALRMRPVGKGDVFGRSGLLTHSYLMGPRGDSNGCVSFKHYDIFLHAFLKGDVKRLVVLKSLIRESPDIAGKA